MISIKSSRNEFLYFYASTDSRNLSQTFNTFVKYMFFNGP